MMHIVPKGRGITYKNLLLTVKCLVESSRSENQVFLRKTYFLLRPDVLGLNHANFLHQNSLQIEVGPFTPLSLPSIPLSVLGLKEQSGFVPWKQISFSCRYLRGKEC